KARSVAWKSSLRNSGAQRPCTLGGQQPHATRQKQKTGVGSVRTPVRNLCRCCKPGPRRHLTDAARWVALLWTQVGTGPCRTLIMPHMLRENQSDVNHSA